VYWDTTKDTASAHVFGDTTIQEKGQPGTEDTVSPLVFLAVLRSRSRKEPQLLVRAGAGAVTRCCSGSDNGIYHG
jgi:hypothetical protein